MRTLPRNLARVDNIPAPVPWTQQEWDAGEPPAWFICPIDGTRMDFINAEAFYRLGARVQPVISIEHLPARAAVEILIDAAKTLRAFIQQHSSEEKFADCVEAASQLLSAVDDAAAPGRGLVVDVFSDHFEVEEETRNVHARRARYEAITITFRKFELSIIPTLRNLPTLMAAPQILGHETISLLRKPLGILPVSTRALLPIEASHDFLLATRCFVSDLWTAGAFHLLRATESVMVKYLQTLGGTVPQEITWASLIHAIGATGLAPKRMVGQLHRLREHERNELYHLPPRFIEEEECWELFDHCKGALVAMLRHMHEISPPAPPRKPSVSPTGRID